MDISNIPGNSDKEREHQQAVAAGSLKKKTAGDKLLSTFIAADAREVKQNIVVELVVPKIKELMYDVVSETLGTLLGVRTTRSARSGGGGQQRASYQKYYEDAGGRYAAPNRNVNAAPGFNYDDVLFPTRTDAEMVIDSMNEQLSRYGRVSVLDFYDFSGITEYNPSMANYGWRDISGTRAVATRDGYILTLPRCTNLR